MPVKKKQKTWEDYPRTKDKIAIVGFASTKNLTPWDDDEYEIMSLNEGYNFKWFKRPADRWLQIHPHWDFEKSNNQNDPNHFLWLKNESGPCNNCEGKGYLPKKDGTQKECGDCEKGTYTPPKSRAKLPIYMQEAYSDVPNSIEYPLDLIHDKFFKDKHPEKYFTSSASYMLGLAMLMGYKQIDFYGFEMATSSEYHYQRANFEYLVGVAHGKGFNVHLPKKSPILKGELYAFENMQQPYRQNLEMRKVFLGAKKEQAKAEMFKLAGGVEILRSMNAKEEEGAVKKAIEEGKPFVAPYLAKAQEFYHKAMGTMNVYVGAEEETKNLTELYDEYYRGGVESTRTTEELQEEFVHLEYEKGNDNGKEEK